MNTLLATLVLIGACARTDDHSDKRGGADSGAIVTDTGCDPARATDWFADEDGDGFGDPSVRVVACERPAGMIANSTDCDDRDAAVSPGARETCDGVDDDCDGVPDDGLEELPWYVDADLDGYGSADSVVFACAAPLGHVPEGTDCDDARADVNPGAAEVCDNEADDNCDGEAPGCGISGTLDLSSSDAILAAEASYDAAGSTVVGAGDVDGDGFDDVLVGAPQAGDENTGAAYLVLGPVTGAGSLAGASATLVGEGAGDQAGVSVSGAGDTNADGFPDLLVGADHASGLGTAWLVLGPVSGNLNLSSADATFVGENVVDRLGYSLAGAGDVDGDGHADLLLGAFGYEGAGPASGAVYVIRGPVPATPDLAMADAKLLGEDVGDYAGCSVARAGDVDADGVDDLVIGAPHGDGDAPDSGVAYLVSGPVSGELTLAAADAKLSGEQEGDLAGIAVAGAGDVDGDGHADLLVGAFGNDEGGEYAGIAYLLLGPVSGTRGLVGADARLVGEDVSHRAGAAVSGAGDVDRDGRDDILVGAYGASGGGPYSGAGYVLTGPIAGTIDLADADAVLVGAAAGDRAGQSVAGAGDVDGDGWSDVLVGAPYAGFQEAGAAYLLLGGGL